jgi:hypothetical protein
MMPSSPPVRVADAANDTNFSVACWADARGRCAPQAVQQRMGHGVGSRVTSEVYGWVTPASEQASDGGTRSIVFDGSRPLRGLGERGRTSLRLARTIDQAKRAWR